MSSTDSPAVDSPFPASLSEEVRKVSWADHEEAAGNAYFDRLLGGELTPRHYALLIRQHHAVYTALEAVADALADDRLAGPFVDPKLRRVPALEQDLVATAGQHWPDSTEVLGATADYVEHLRATASDPVAFVAQHYVRYLGDLSGGQYIGKAIERVFHVENHRGTSFYVFDAIDSPKAYKEAYRQKLDAMDLTDEERKRFIDTTLAAYRMNTAMHAGLADAVAAPR